MKATILWTLIYFAGHGTAPIYMPMANLVACKNAGSSVVEKMTTQRGCFVGDYKCAIEAELSHAFCIGSNGVVWKIHSGFDPKWKIAPQEGK